MDTAAWYRWFAEHEARGSSPCYERLASAIADDDECLAWLARLPAAKRQPNLLFASTRFLGGPTDTIEDFVEFLRSASDHLAATMTARSTQTNEAARCGAFLPVLAEVDGEVALIEVGASAGLCLLPDRYSYRYDADLIGESDLEIRVDTAGTLRAPRRRPEVHWRAGLDLDPLDVTDPTDLSWLRACVWPEHHERRRRLDAAASIAARQPPRILRGDLRVATLGLIDEAPEGATKVVFHSAVLAYVDEPDRRAFASTMRQAVMERSDVIWLSNEAPSVLTATGSSAAPVVAPVSGASFHLVRNGIELLATTDPHGGWLRWARPSVDR